MNTTKFEITVQTNTDVEPAERFASVEHIASGCGCDFYESGEELEWQDNNGLLSSCDDEIIQDARSAAKKALKKTNYEIKPGQKIQDPVMDDCGTEYFATFEYRVEGDVDLYGDDEWRMGKIVWLTTDAWKSEEERVRLELEENPDARVDPGLLDDESMACDWDQFEVQDENGEALPESTAKAVAELLS